VVLRAGLLFEKQVGKALRQPVSPPFARIAKRMAATSAEVSNVDHARQPLDFFQGKELSFAGAGTRLLSRLPRLAALEV
jgi:hypothetical protein